MSDDKQTLILANSGMQSPIPAEAPGVMYEPPPPYSFPGEASPPSQYVKPYPTSPYPEQEPKSYPGQQPTPYPGQQPIPYPGQQPTPYPGQQPTPYPGQQTTSYPGQQPTPYPGQQPTPYPGQKPPMQQYQPSGQQFAPPGTIVIAQSPPIIIAQLPPTNVLGRESTRTICPHCSSNMSTKVDKDPTMAAYISSAIMVIFGCICGCCLIPFCIDSCRQSEHYCPNCKRHLGTVAN